jgi:hypothetical protein
MKVVEGGVGADMALVARRAPKESNLMLNIAVGIGP